jgi:hypothetical protein
MRPEAAHKILDRDNQPDIEDPSVPKIDKAPRPNGGTDTPIGDHDLIPPAMKGELGVLKLGAEELRTSTAAAPSTDAGKLILTVTEFLDSYAQSEYVVDGLFKRGFFYSFTAMTGGGKTAIALAIAELASNKTRRRKLGNHDVEHVRVLYIACENAEDVRERLIGMESKMDFDRKDLDMLVIDQVFDLEKNLNRIFKEVDDFGGNIGLAFIDTSAAMFQGADENNNTQMITHAKSQRKLCKLSGRPSVVALNHPTKIVSGPEFLLPRGGGGYLNETDGNFTAWAHGERLSRFHWTGKLRGPDFEPIIFRMPTVYTTKLADKKNRLMPTVAAEVATDAQVMETEEKAVFQENRLLAAMHKRPNGSLTEWAQDCEWFFPAKPGEPAQPYKSLVTRVLKRLTDDKRVKKTGRNYTIAKGEKDAAAKSKKDAAEKAASEAVIVPIVPNGAP